MGYEVRNLAKGDGLWVNHIQGGGTLAAYEVAYLDANGRWQAADADAVATMPVVGLTTEPLRVNQRGRVLLQGFANNNAWAWNPGALLYASTGSGALTESPPVGPGDVVQEIGVAVSATLIYFDGAGLGGSGSAGAGTLLAGATAYVGSEATLSGFANYFYTGDYATHTLLFAAAVAYVGTLGGGSISVEAMTYTGIVVINQDEVLFYGQGWDTYVNGGTEGHAITASGNRCVVRDIQVRTTPGQGNAFYGINSTGIDNFIDNVFVNGSDNIGVLLTGASNKIINSYIFDTDTVGLQIQGINTLVQGNELNTIGAAGITVIGTADGSVMSNNIIDTSGDDAITIASGATMCSVQGNSLTGWTNEAIDNDEETTTISNDNNTGHGQFQTQTGVIAVPTVTAGGVWEGRIIEVENSTEGRYFSYSYQNAGWRGVEYL